MPPTSSDFRCWSKVHSQARAVVSLEVPAPHLGARPARQAGLHGQDMGFEVTVSFSSSPEFRKSRILHIHQSTAIYPHWMKHSAVALLMNVEYSFGLLCCRHAMQCAGRPLPTPP